MMSGYPSFYLEIFFKIIVWMALGRCGLAPKPQGILRISIIRVVIARR